MAFVTHSILSGAEIDVVLECQPEVEFWVDRSRVSYRSTRRVIIGLGSSYSFTA